MKQRMMKQGLALAAASVALVFSCGCANRYASAAPPPPPAYNQRPSPIVGLADRNGFQTGEADGSRDAYDGRPYRARSTPAYFKTPGYDGNLGPFGVYQNSFRLAYLRGYDKGFHHG